MNTTTPLNSLRLEGKYVRLIPLEMGHAGALTKAANISRKIFSHTSGRVNIETSLRHIQMANYLLLTRSAIPLAIEEKSRGKIIGSTGFLNLEYWDISGGHNLSRAENIPTVVDIGSTWFGEPDHEPKMVLDSKVCLLNHAFKEWDVLRVGFKTDVRNLKSRRVIERIGAKLEGVSRAHSQNYDREVSNTAFYSILKPEWLKLKRQPRSIFR